MGDASRQPVTIIPHGSGILLLRAPSSRMLDMLINAGRSPGHRTGSESHRVGTQLCISGMLILAMRPRYIGVTRTARGQLPGRLKARTWLHLAQILQSAFGMPTVA